MVLFGKFLHVVGYILDFHVLAHFVIVNVGFHVDKVDYTFKSLFLADWELYRHRIALKPVFHHLHNTEKVSAHNVHFIDIRHARHAELLRLAPYCL